MLKDSVQQAQRRALQYWHNDGLFEMAFGLFCLLLALYFYAHLSLSPDSPLYNLLDASIALIIIGGAFLVGKMIQWGKRRFIYPRTGFVSVPRKRSLPRWATGLLAMTIASLVSGLVLASPASLSLMPLITGVILSIVLLIISLRVSLRRFYLLAALSILVGAALAVAGIGNTAGLAAFYGLMGGAILLSGALTFTQYLRTTTPPGEELP